MRYHGGGATLGSEGILLVTVFTVVGLPFIVFPICALIGIRKCRYRLLKIALYGEFPNFYI